MRSDNEVFYNLKTEEQQEISSEGLKYFYKNYKNDRKNFYDTKKNEILVSGIKEIFKLMSSFEIIALHKIGKIITRLDKKEYEK